MHMRTLCTRVAAGILAAALVACGGADEAQDAAVEIPPTAAPAPEAGAAPPATARPTAGSGTARVSFATDADSVGGDFATRLCGGPYMMGEGVAYQTEADGWQVTVATEAREAGQVPLNTPDGAANVIVTVNGPGKQFVRGRSSGGSLVIADDFRRAEADVELRGVAGGETARLVATFTCDPPA